VGNPHTTLRNVDRLIDEGYGFLMQGPVKTYPAIEKALARYGIGRSEAAPSAAY
jgi:hypothetical protein